MKEIETQQSKQQLSMRKTASVPNFSQVRLTLNFYLYSFTTMSKGIGNEIFISCHNSFFFCTNENCVFILILMTAKIANFISLHFIKNCFLLTKTFKNLSQAVKEAALNGGVSKFSQTFFLEKKSSVEI